MASSAPTFRRAVEISARRNLNHPEVTHSKVGKLVLSTSVGNSHAIVPLFGRLFAR